MSTFTVAGISVNKGKVKVRFCSDKILRIKNLMKQGDTDIELVDLPQALDKWHACEFLLNSGKFNQYTEEIIKIQGKKQLISKQKQPIIKVESVKVDPELEAIKELAAA